MTSKFQFRSDSRELMDNLHSGGAVIEQTLNELEVINTWLGGNHVTINGLERLLQPLAFIPEDLTLVDLGCGGGDMLKLIAKWARKKGYKLKLIGVDANSNIVDIAQRNTKNYPEIEYKDINIFCEDFKSMKFDIVTSTLFTHHFRNDQLTCLFSQLRRQARLGMVINDLHRHWFAYYSIKWLTAIFSRSEMVRHDAAISVLRAFHKDELNQLLKDSGIAEFELRWMWAFRWQVVAWL